MRSKTQVPLPSTKSVMDKVNPGNVCHYDGANCKVLTKDRPAYRRWKRRLMRLLLKKEVALNSQPLDIGSAK